MKKIITTIVFTCFVLSSMAQESARRADIKKLLDLTGAAKVGVQVAQQMSASFQQMYPDVPSEFWDEFIKEIKEDDLVELVIPVYEKYYTEEDVKGLIEFYESPLGRKVTKTLPAITQESMQAGQEWGRKLGEKVVERLSEKGYFDKK